MIVSSLVETERFKVTENREHADAILKGVALEKSSQELHAYGEGTAVHRSAITDSSAHTETINEAKVSIRLVDPEGDVIWTSTQESKGAKYKGSSADVADKCIKQLLRDVEKLEHAQHD
jgi:curli biogenesis system outer membrane secretion channel CsgG